MSGWQSSLSFSNVISNLLFSNSIARPNRHPEPLQNNDGIEGGGHSTGAGVQAPPGPAPKYSQRPDGSTRIECLALACASYSSEVDFSTEPPTSACSHSPEVCINCLQRVILTAINSGEFILESYALLLTALRSWIISMYADGQVRRHSIGSYGASVRTYLLIML
jgi:hypothetical protein